MFGQRKSDIEKQLSLALIAAYRTLERHERELAALAEGFTELARRVKENQVEMDGSLAVMEERIDDLARR